MSTLLSIRAQRNRFDVDAADYFARAEALGGSFDQRSINSLYTPSYVKSAINKMIVGMKQDGTWALLKEAYLFCGVSFNGITAKLKKSGAAALTNNGFVSSDFIAAGTGAGLNKNVSTKGMWTGMLAGTDFFPLTSMHLSYYAISVTTGGAFMSDLANSTNQSSLLSSSARIPSNATATGGTATSTGLIMGSCQSTNLRKRFVRGSSVATNSTIPSWVATNTDIALFRHRSSSTVEISVFKSTFFSIGAGFSDAQALQFSNRVHQLMIDLGANPY